MITPDERAVRLILCAMLFRGNAHTIVFRGLLADYYEWVELDANEFADAPDNLPALLIDGKAAVWVPSLGMYCVIDPITVEEYVKQAQAVRL